MMETLNILETYDTPAPYGSTLWAHRLAESYQRAFLDRNNKLGDPAFVAVPQDELTSKSYARQLRAKIDDACTRRRRRSSRSARHAHDALFGRRRAGQRRRDDHDIEQQLWLGGLGARWRIFLERRDG
jgi:gamma-glutamyltranspeptidase